MYKIRVPATSANLGPGFDVLGLALGLYNEFVFEEIDAGLELLGFEEAYNNKDNLVYRALLRGLEEFSYQVKGLRIKAKIAIPISRGLGSSASCIVAGLAAAFLLAGQQMDREKLFSLASQMEGHGDNVAAAIFGGLTMVQMEEGEVLCHKLDLAAGLKIFALIPDYTISTSQARQVLPARLDYDQAVANLSSLAFLIAALTSGQFNLLKYGLKDYIHQPYRGPLVKDFYPILDQAEDLGAWGGFLSGAGPTIICLYSGEGEVFQEQMELYLGVLADKWKICQLNPDYRGLIIEGEDKLRDDKDD